jgi:hypothetical protein
MVSFQLFGGWKRIVEVTLLVPDEKTCFDGPVREFSLELANHGFGKTVFG